MVGLDELLDAGPAANPPAPRRANPPTPQRPNLPVPHPQPQRANLPVPQAQRGNPPTSQRGNPSAPQPRAGGRSLLAAGLLATLTGRTPPALVARHRAARDALRLAADPDAASFLDRATRLLSARLAAQDRPLPPVFAATLTDDALVLHLAPAPLDPPPSPWWTGGAPGAWRIERHPETQDGLPPGVGETIPSSVPAPFPGLATVGRDGDGARILVDVEGAPGVIAIDGDRARAREIAVSIAVELATNQWSDDLRVHLIGFPADPSAIAPERLRSAATVGEALAQLAAREDWRTHATGTRWDGFDAEQVLRGRQEAATQALWAPDLLVLASPPDEADAAQLARFARGRGQAVGVIVADELAAARWVFTAARDGRLSLGVLGIDVAAQLLPADQYTTLVDLFRSLNDAPNGPRAGARTAVPARPRSEHLADTHKSSADAGHSGSEAHPPAPIAPAASPAPPAPPAPPALPMPPALPVPPPPMQPVAATGGGGGGGTVNGDPWAAPATFQPAQPFLPTVPDETPPVLPGPERLGAAPAVTVPVAPPSPAVPAAYRSAPLADPARTVPTRASEPPPARPAPALIPPLLIPPLLATPAPPAPAAPHTDPSARPTAAAPSAAPPTIGRPDTAGPSTGHPGMAGLSADPAVATPTQTDEPGPATPPQPGELGGYGPPTSGPHTTPPMELPATSSTALPATSPTVPATASPAVLAATSPTVPVAASPTALPVVSPTAARTLPRSGGPAGPPPTSLPDSEPARRPLSILVPGTRRRDLPPGPGDTSPPRSGQQRPAAVLPGPATRPSQTGPVSPIDLPYAAAAPPATPRAEVAAQGDAEILVLGRPTVHAPGPIARDQVEPLTELLVYLALHPDGAHPRALSVALGPADTGRGSATPDAAAVDTVTATALGRARDWLGTGPSGHPRLVTGPDGRLRLGQDVRCDWWAFAAHAHRAGGRPGVKPAGGSSLATIGGAGTVETELATALGLVTGPLFTGLPAGRYGWLRSTGLDASLCTAVVDVAHQLAEHSLDLGDTATAMAACRTGLRAVPAAETLWRDLLRTVAARGDRRTLEAVAAEMYRALPAGAGTQPAGSQTRGRRLPAPAAEPETNALVRSLLPGFRHRGRR